MSTPHPDDLESGEPQPRDIALEQESEEQAVSLEEQSEPEQD